MEVERSCPNLRTSRIWLDVLYALTGKLCDVTLLFRCFGGSSSSPAALAQARLGR